MSAGGLLSLLILKSVRGFKTVILITESKGKIFFCGASKNYRSFASLRMTPLEILTVVQK